MHGGRESCQPLGCGERRSGCFYTAVDEHVVAEKHSWVGCMPHVNLVIERRNARAPIGPWFNRFCDKVHVCGARDRRCDGSTRRAC